MGVEMNESELIFDWNTADGDLPTPRVELNDETLRDGLQSPSVRAPSVDRQLEVLHKIEELGTESANIGLPGAGPHVVESVRRLAREIVDSKMKLAPNCAARTLQQDIEPIVEISQQVGVPIEASCFIGSSPIRQYAEGWDIEKLLRLTQAAIGFAVAQGLPVMYVTEDTTRARPDDLRQLYAAAVHAGATRVCIADTVGHSTPRGAAAVVRFVRQVVDEAGSGVKVDWHGHRDRDLAVINSIAAAEAGADRLHGTALGIGERVGNTPLDLLLVNLRLMGWIDRDLSALPSYCRLVSEVSGIPMPDNYPVVGRDAFRTATGVHAAAIIKARRKGDEWLADRIYSGVPAGWVGRRQRIEIGPMCGRSNVIHWLAERGVEATEALVDELLERAKRSPQVLDRAEIETVCARHGVRPGPRAPSVERVGSPEG